MVGLDFVKRSRFVKGRPFLQAFAYAQVLRGGTLNATFARHASSLVVFKERRPSPWTWRLELAAERVQDKDFDYFDYAVVNATDDLHAQLSARPKLSARTHETPWRLYRVEPAKPAPARPE